MKSLLPLVVAVLLPHLAAAQSVSLQDNVLQDWTRLKDTMMKIAAAMPDDKFGYRATAPEGRGASRSSTSPRQTSSRWDDSERRCRRRRTT